MDYPEYTKLVNRVLGLQQVNEYITRTLDNSFSPVLCLASPDWKQKLDEHPVFQQYQNLKMG